MNIASALQAGLDVLIAMSGGTLRNTSDQSIRVFKSFLRNRTRTMSEYGYDDTYDDLYVIAKPSDVVGWTLSPLKTKLYLDDVPYYVGRTTTETSGYITIWLRKEI